MIKHKVFSMIFALMWALPFGLFSRNISAAAKPQENYQIVLGPVEVVRGPDLMSDNPFHTLELNGKLMGYLGNIDTIGYSGRTLETLDQLAAPVIAQGTGFDSCGAWLNSTWQDGAIIRAWYHAETNCDYPSTDKSVAYAESLDGGRTFAKPSYPNNQVITAPARTSGADNDEGDQRVIRIGDYLYMYFTASRDWQVHVARSLVTDGGKPGTFFKYYNGAFSQPGIGGESSPIDPTGKLTRTWISHDTALGAYIGFSYQKRNYSDLPGKYAGLGFTLSQNGLTHWTSLPYVVLPTEGSYWGRDKNSLPLTEYPSMIGYDGDDEEIGSTFWLYYMTIDAGENFNKRYLVRRKVSIEETTLTDPTDIVPRVALSQYRDGKDTWFTTNHVTQGYQYIDSLGYLFTDHIRNSTPVYDCYLPFWDDHMLVAGDSSCGGGYARLNGRVGWLSSVPFQNSQAVYRCFDAEKSNHFLSFEPNCAGKTAEWRMGYMVPSQASRASSERSMTKTQGAPGE